MSPTAETRPTLLEIDADRRCARAHRSVVLVVDGKEVGVVSATYDLSLVRPEHQWYAVQTIRDIHPSVRVAMTSPEERRRVQGWLNEYSEWAALPWWRRIFTRRPRG